MSPYPRSSIRISTTLGLARCGALCPGALAIGGSTMRREAASAFIEQCDMSYSRNGEHGFVDRCQVYSPACRSVQRVGLSARPTMGASVHRGARGADWRAARLLVVNHRPGSPMQRLVSLVLLLALVCLPAAAHGQQPRVLVFSKTAGFRHSSIGVGRAAIR